MARFLMFVVPATFWDDRPRATPPTDDELLREQLREARALRERIAGRVNIESERTRYTETVSQIEATLLKRLLAAPKTTRRPQWDESGLREELALGRFPALWLGDDYLHLLAVTELARARKRMPGMSVAADPLALGESIYRADQIPGHLERSSAELGELGKNAEKVADVAASRRAFLELVQRIGGHGVVEVQVVQDNGRPIVALPDVREPQAVHETAVAFATLPVEQEQGRDLGRNQSRRREMVDRLYQDAKQAVEQFFIDGRGGKVNASNQPHEVTTDVLGEWVRVRDARGPSRIRITYADASEALPFPVCCLAGRAMPAGEPRVIRVALMSMRHLEIDRTVDMAWFRNREVSQARSLAESDEYCFTYSLGELAKLAEVSGSLKRPIQLHVYHTGFEPASMGFYRAVASMLANDESLHMGRVRIMLVPWISIVPQYYRGGTTYQPSQDRHGQPIVWF